MFLGDKITNLKTRYMTAIAAYRVNPCPKTREEYIHSKTQVDNLKVTLFFHSDILVSSF